MTCFPRFFFCNFGFFNQLCRNIKQSHIKLKSFSSWGARINSFDLKNNIFPISYKIRIYKKWGKYHLNFIFKIV